MIAGLGNPGPVYRKTRHNAGFWLVERLAESRRLRFRRPWFRNYHIASFVHNSSTIYLVKPTTFMNLSGWAVAPLIEKLDVSLENLLVVVDQMDLPPGKIRWKRNGSNAGHNGLRSIEDRLGTTEYKRLYVGIGRPKQGTIIDYVLGVPDDEDARKLETAIDACVETTNVLIESGWEAFAHGIQERFRDARPTT